MNVEDEIKAKAKTLCTWALKCSKCTPLDVKLCNEPEKKPKLVSVDDVLVVLRQHEATRHQQLEKLKIDILECLRCVDEGVPLTSEGVDYIRKKFEGLKPQENTEEL